MSNLTEFRWLFNWQTGLVLLILLTGLLQWVLTRTQPDSTRILRNNLVAGAACVALSLLSRLLASAGIQHGADLLQEVAILGLGLLFIRICGITAFRVLLPAMHLHPPRILEDILLILTYIAWGMVRLRTAGLDLSGMVATSAVITAVIAFSMQDTLGNILGGLALQLDNSVRIGDWIKVDDVRGRVMEVHWRHTVVHTNNGDVIVIPNSVLMKSKVVVFSRADKPNFRRWIYFNVTDSVPPQDVIGVVEKAVRGAFINHVAPLPAPQCIVTDYREGLIQYAVRYWLTDPMHDDGTDSVVRLHLYSALQRQNFSLGHPCMDIRLNTASSEQTSDQLEEKIAKRVQALSRVKLFSSLSEDELRQIATTVRDSPYIKNDVMTKQGTVAHSLYLLISGEADVWFESDTQEKRHLATLKEGAVFGEMGLLTGEPRRATVIARTNAQCYRLDKENFATILQDRPELATEFAQILSERNQELASARKDDTPSGQTQHANLLLSIRRFFRLP